MMSQTLRMYAREYGTGTVHLIGGWNMLSWNHVYDFLRKEAEGFAADLGVQVQGCLAEGLYAIKVEGHRAVGRYYFVAESPLQVPLGEGWQVLENGEGNSDLDIVFGFDLDGHKVRLNWQPMTQDEIDEQHGNDEFGGWRYLSLVIDDGPVIPLDDDYAVRLMMMDAIQVESLTRLMV